MDKIYKFKLACLSLVTLAMTSSCLDFEPEAQLSDAQVWTTAENFQLFANQFYGWMRDFNSSTNYRCGLSDGVHSDLRSDLLAGSAVNTYSAGTNSITSTDNNYTSLYTHIYYTNLLLDRAASYGNQSEISVPVAEAKFFRAYCYFELVQIFGDVTLVTTPLDMTSGELQAPRDDRGTVVDQIVKDLQEAAQALPVTASEEGRVTVDAANALLSRIALYEGTWQKFHSNGSATTSNTSRSTELLTMARDAAKAVIDAGNYSLFYDSQLGNESYRYMFILEDAQCNPAGLQTSANTEYILSTRHRIEDGCGYNVTKTTLTNAIYPTRKWAQLYLCSDGLPIDKSPLFQGYSTAVSEFQNRDNRMGTTLVRHGDIVWNNTTNNCRQSWNADDNSRALTVSVTSNSGYQTHKWAVERYVTDRMEAMDYPVIRYAEVLLNYAEAVYELDGSISDADLNISLNLVRRRVNGNMPALTNSFATTNGLDMREEIRRERTVELVMEGFRIDDLKRWATAPVEMPMDQVGVLYTGTWFETNWTSQARQLTSDGCILLYGDRVWDDKLYLYPLPSNQIQLNPNLGQNPGWD